jgi:hypothetical protein
MAVMAVGVALCSPAEEGNLAEFKRVAKGGDVLQVLALGPGVVKAFPDDAISRLQYAQALYAAGRFDDVLALDGATAVFPASAACFDSILGLGFYLPDWQLWRLRIAAMVGCGQLDTAMTELELMSKFEDGEMLFLGYAVLEHMGKKDEAGGWRDRWLPDPYVGKPSGLVYARRAIPAMVADDLTPYLSSATTDGEYRLLHVLA